MGNRRKRELKLIYIPSILNDDEREIQAAQEAQEKIIRFIYQKVILKDTGS